MNRILNVLSDYQHMGGFKLQYMILQLLIQAVAREDLIHA